MEHNLLQVYIQALPEIYRLAADTHRHGRFWAASSLENQRLKIHTRLVESIVITRPRQGVFVYCQKGSIVQGARGEFGARAHHA